MSPRRVLILLAVAATAAAGCIVAAASAKPSAPASQPATELAGSPVRPETFDPPVAAPAGPLSTEAPEPTPTPLLAAAGGEARRLPSPRAVLVDAQVLEKYRSFRDSLSAP